MVRFLINIRKNNYWSKHFIASGTRTIGKICNKHQGKQLLVKTLHSIRNNNH